MMNMFFTLDRYQRLSRKTANLDDPPWVRICNWSLGLAGEVGETIDLVKKEMFHGHPLATDDMRKELGDILWYLANLATEYHLTLSDIATVNLDKLQKRYEDGFSSEASINREEE